MRTVQTHPGNASTFLTHLFGQGLDDDRYVVERFRSMADGDIRPLRAGGPGTIVSRQAVRKMRPARRRDHRCNRNQPPELRGPILGLDRNGIVLRPQAEALSGVFRVDVLPARRRPAVLRLDPNPGRETPMPFKDPDKAREHDRERCRRRTAERLASGCVRSAEESPSLPNAACAIPAARSGGSLSAPGTPGARPPAGPTAAGTPRTAAGSGGREAGGASGHAGAPASVRAAATVPPSRAGRPARFAVTPGKRPNGSSMWPGGPRASAAGAADRPLTAPPAAVPARPSRPGAIHGERGPAVGATPAGARGGVAPTVANPRRERRGACRARTGPGCAQACIGACRSFRRATP